MFFFMALYMQNILGYSPLEAGIRFLPTTVVIIVAAPIAGRLTDRIGARIPIAVGLTLVAIALFLQSRSPSTPTYCDLLPPFVLMGLGIGLTMSPMSTAAMNAVEVTKAGVASGILSMSRMVGGTFGVAAVGALFQQMSDNRLADRLGELPLSPSSRPGSRTTSAPAMSTRTSSSSTRRRRRRSATCSKDAFVYSLSASLRLSTAVAALES